MNRFKYAIFILFFCVIFISPVYAEDSCDYKEEAKLNKLANEVSANYDVVTDDSGKESIVINIYNIPEGMYVAMSTEGYPSTTTETTTGYIYYNQMENGKYSFGVSDITNIVKYTFRVKSDKCSSFVRQFTMIKPMKNKFSDMDICKYQEVLDYYYCKSWLTQEITETDQKIKDKIDRERLRNTSTTTTRCYSCEQREKEEQTIARMKRIKMYVIIGLSIGIAVDILVMILLIVRIRRYSI